MCRSQIHAYFDIFNHKNEHKQSFKKITKNDLHIFFNRCFLYKNNMFL